MLIEGLLVVADDAETVSDVGGDSELQPPSWILYSIARDIALTMHKGFAGEIYSDFIQIRNTRSGECKINIAVCLLGDREDLVK
jgi:hypothetical protein